MKKLQKSQKMRKSQKFEKMRKTKNFHFSSRKSSKGTRISCDRYSPPPSRRYRWISLENSFPGATRRMWYEPIPRKAWVRLHFRTKTQLPCFFFDFFGFLRIFGIFAEIREKPGLSWKKLGFRMKSAISSSLRRFPGIKDISAAFPRDRSPYKGHRSSHLEEL